MHQATGAAKHEGRQSWSRSFRPMPLTKRRTEHMVTIHHRGCDLECPWHTALGPCVFYGALASGFRTGVCGTVACCPKCPAEVLVALAAVPR